MKNPFICCECEGPLRGGFCWFCDSRAETSFANDPNSNFFDDSQNHSEYSPQPSTRLTCASYVGMILIMVMIVHYGKYNEINSQIPPADAITTSPPVLPIEDPEDSLIVGNEDLNTILEKKSDEFIKSSVEDLVPIPVESEDTSGSESVCILPSCDYFSPIDVLEEKDVTFSNPLFNSNDNFISSNDESLSDEDVPEENVKIYLNPLFEFDDECISSDIDHLFDEVLENIESKNSYDSNLDEPDLLVTPLSDAYKDKCFDSGGDVDKINDFEDGYYDSEGDILYLQSLLNDDLVHHDPSLKENDDLFNLT
nr:hypothetical protein [Tanacetum cinerariifolium]